MKERIYIETSVISVYTARLSNDLIKAARQRITQEWWEKVIPKYECVISPYVLQEIRLGDRSAATKRIEASNPFGLLTTNDFTEELSQEYFRKSGIPKKSLLDCYHLAIAATNGVDFIVSWNFKHIANPTIRKIFRNINDSHNLVSPEISTPEEMLG
jgi:predicted nucleic acid-binding protein